MEKSLLEKLVFDANIEKACTVSTDILQWGGLNGNSTNDFKSFYHHDNDTIASFFSFEQECLKIDCYKLYISDFEERNFKYRKHIVYYVPYEHITMVSITPIDATVGSSYYYTLNKYIETVRKDFEEGK